MPGKWLDPKKPLPNVLIPAQLKTLAAELAKRDLTPPRPQYT